MTCQNCSIAFKLSMKRFFLIPVTQCLTIFDCSFDFSSFALMDFIILVVFYFMCFLLLYFMFVLLFYAFCIHLCVCVYSYILLAFVYFCIYAFYEFLFLNSLEFLVFRIQRFLVSKLLYNYIYLSVCQVLEETFLSLTN